MYEISSTWAWGAGIVVGSFLVVSFLINAKVGLLLYILIMPALQPLMGVTVAIPGSAATVALGGPLQAIILMVALFQVVRLNIKSLKAPVVLVFIVLWLVMGISMVRSPDTILAVKEWGRIGSLLFIYILAGLSFKGEKDTRQFVRVLLLSLVVPLGLAGYQAVTHTGLSNWLESYNRVSGTYGGSPVEFALYLTFPLLLCITMAMDRKMRGEGRVFFAFCVVVLASFLFLTYTRSSWFGLMAGIMVIGLKRNKGLLVAAPLLALLVALVAPLESIRLGEFTTGALSFSGRIQGWTHMLPLVKDFPILGRGLTGFSAYTQSDHVRLLLETGFLGWIAFLCLICVLLKALLKAHRSSQSGIEKNFSLAYLAFFVCTFVISFAETNAFLQYYVWIPAGIVLSKNMQRIRRKPDTNSATEALRGSCSPMVSSQGAKYPHTTTVRPDFIR